ncbi:MAG: UDP-2,4-diacetamido-2,4,6-trideoxy-beta-L-altropyranose hydrolase [Clostridiales bacterium]|nr:UDP-2,4-diacetamido-2,4,6-trideoxy-beta-L-altropyranose hydrolase [Clostridiales bacterium]
MIIFRADGNKLIGAGHIMRCLSIANAAKETGKECKFFLASDDFEKIIKEYGHQAEVLNSDYSVPDPDEIISRLDSDKPSAVIVDSYFITEDYMKTVHKRCSESGCKLVYIDDRCNLACSCDAVINYNISADVDEYRNLYEGKQEPVFLTGTAYTPLRKEFRNRDPRVVSEKGRNIFVSTGGADPEHFTTVLVEEAKNYKDYSFHFVLGMMNPDKEIIKKSVSDYSNIDIHENVTEMGKLMRSCDVAISASGSTLYELCAIQTPAITYILADNQIPLAQTFDKKGIIKNLGDIRITGNHTLAGTLINEAVKLAGNYDERVRIANAMASLVDGNGAGRIIEGILG